MIAATLFGLGDGAPAAEPEAVKLDEITVKGEGMREADKAFTVNTISEETIQSKSWSSPLKIFEEAPGVQVVGRNSGSVADNVTIRGLTGGGHGGDLGASLDGISLNEAEGHADGYADVQVIIPLEIQSLTVYKGPVSPLYGNFARGGHMAWETRKGGEYTDFQFAGGSYRTYDMEAAFGTKIDAPFGPLQFNGALQGYESGGWRDNSRFTKANGALRTSYMIDDNNEIALSLRAHGARSQVPGNITDTQFDEGWDARRAQSPVDASQHGNAEKTYNSTRLDFNHSFTENLKLLSWLYHTHMTLERYEVNVGPATDPATCAGMTTGTRSCEIDRAHDRDVDAVGASLNGSQSIGSIPANWVLGSEYYSEDTHENEWLTNALDRGFVAGIPERKIRDRDYTTDTLSVFGQMDLAVHRLFRPTLGFRFDKFHQTGDPNGNPLDTMPDYDENNHVLTPKLGVRSAITEHFELRASYAEGFALPSIDQRGLGQLDPVKFKQYEVGFNATPTREIYLDLAYFMLNSSDEIQLNPTTAQFENVGKTERTGVEGEIHYLPELLKYVDLSATFGFYDTDIKENVANPALEGKKITKVPDHVANLTAAYEPPQGFGARLRWRTVGKMYVSNDNAGTYDGYDTVDLSLFYTLLGQNGHSTRFYIDGNNLTNEAYANGPGGSNGVDHPVTYNPMPPANVMLGVILKM